MKKIFISTPNKSNHVQKVCLYCVLQDDDCQTLTEAPKMTLTFWRLSCWFV